MWPYERSLKFLFNRQWLSRYYNCVNVPLIWDCTTAHSEIIGVWLTHKYGYQWALVVDIDNSWSTVGVECTSRWDLSTLIERSSPIEFERLSLRIYGIVVWLMEKNFHKNRIWTWANRIYHMIDVEVWWFIYDLLSSQNSW